MNPEVPLPFTDLRRIYLAYGGQIVTAEMTEGGARLAAERILTIKEKLEKGNTTPLDLPIAVLASGQLLARLSQEQVRVSSRSKAYMGDPEQIAKLKQELIGNVEKEQRNRIIRDLCVADPLYGANNAMFIFELLCSRYPDIRLSPPSGPTEPPDPASGDELPLGVA